MFYLQLKQYSGLASKDASGRWGYGRVKNICQNWSVQSLYIFFVENQKMSFFPGGMQPGYQVLWQPVAIQQIQNQTIQQLRWENNMLKSQLQSVLKGQHHPVHPNYDHRIATTDRFSQGPPQCAYMTKRTSENAQFSPRMFQNHQRISSHHSPRLKDCLSPSYRFPHPITQQSTILGEQMVRRMVISRDKDGKYFRDRTQETQQSNFLQSNNSPFYRTSGAESAFTTPLKSNLKKSHFPNMAELKSAIQKSTMNRWKSPSFLKERNRSKSKGAESKVKCIKFYDTIDCQQHELALKRTLPTNQFSDKTNQDKEQKLGSQSPRQKRDSVRIPTIDLSVECDSQLSIERVVRQLRKQNKKKRQDSFLFEIEQQLEGMYGKQNRR